MRKVPAVQPKTLEINCVLKTMNRPCQLAVNTLTTTTLSWHNGIMAPHHAWEHGAHSTMAAWHRNMAPHHVTAPCMLPLHCTLAPCMAPRERGTLARTLATLQHSSLICIVATRHQVQGTMEPWPHGTLVAPWHSGNMAKCICCTLERWQCGSAVPWGSGSHLAHRKQPGALAPWYPGTLSPWRCCTLATWWHHGLLALWHPGSLAQWHCGP